MKKPIINLNQTCQTLNFSSIETKIFDTEFKGTTIDCQLFDEFNGCVFKRVSFINLEAVDFIDCRFENCELANFQMESCLWLRVELINCKLIGLEGLGFKFDNVLFNDCSLNYCNFSESIFKQSIMHHCQIKEIYLSKITCQNFVIRDCEVELMELFNAKLTTFDISTSMINNILINVASIAGITCNQQQALKLAPLLGIKIK